MLVTGPFSHSRNLNPTAPVFLPATILHPTPIFFPTRIYFPLPPPPPPPPSPHVSFFPLPPHLPPISVTPTRAVMLLSVPNDVTESSLRRDMEWFGEVRGIQMERADEGIVTVHFYNLKDSTKALNEIHERHMQQQQQVHFTTARGLVSGRLVWAHFVFPELNAFPQGNNQGSLVILNLEPTVSSYTLRKIFQRYGHVKELRETPFKRSQRFVEYFDVRDAAIALDEMNGKVIAGKTIVIQFSRPGGLSKRLFLASRFNKNVIFNHNNHYHSPSPPFYDHGLLPSPAIKVGPNNQFYEHQYKNKRKKPKKNMKKYRIDDCFMINEEAFGTGEVKDRRTTVMIKNIPNKYTQELFLNMLDTHCNDYNQRIINEGNKTPMSSYDFVYLPIDFSNKCNVGYGFVNMTSPEAVLRLYKNFHNQHWRVFNSRKICQVTYARIQGLELLKEHFKDARLAGVEMEQYVPVLFTPPRDGKSLTEPIAIVDLETKPVDDDDDDDDSCHSRGSFVSDKTMEGSDG